jgi:hypothetical protein
MAVIAQIELRETSGSAGQRVVSMSIMVVDIRCMKEQDSDFQIACAKAREVFC